MGAWVKLGRKCVCIDDGWSAEQCSAGRLPVRLPRFKETLTISRVRENDGNVFLGFEEIPDTGSNGGWLFAIQYFRPLTLREQDAELFASLLRTQSVPAVLVEAF